MLLDVLKYSLFIDGAAGCTEVAARPEPPAPIPFAEFGVLHLYLPRRPSFDPTHYVTDSSVRRDRHEHMDMIAGQYPADDRNPEFLANLPRDFTDPRPNGTLQNLVPIFRNPNDVITMVKNSVFATVVLHDLQLRKNEGLPFRAFIFAELEIITVISG